MVPDLHNPTEVEEISQEELFSVMKTMKNGKATGGDNLPVDIL
jgi:hypothetical protein